MRGPLDASMSVVGVGMSGADCAASLRLRRELLAKRAVTPPSQQQRLGTSGVRELQAGVPSICKIYASTPVVFPMRFSDPDMLLSWRRSCW